MEHQTIAKGIDNNRFLSTDLVGKKFLRQVVEQILLDGSFHRTGTIIGIVALLCQPVDGLWGDFEGESLRPSIF